MTLSPADASVLKAENLNALGTIVHGFFTRQGGVSQGPYESLNCGFGSGDDQERVAENRRRAVASLGSNIEDLNTVFQVHGADVLIVDALAPGANNLETSRQAPKSDAVVSNLAGVVLGILTADCAPVLLADPAAGVVGAAHAGWRGLLAGVIEATVAAMVSKGASTANIRAAVGPCIGAASYEVDDRFAAAFITRDGAQERFFSPAERPGHRLFDLAGCTRRRLLSAGLGKVEALAYDTYRDEDRFFSYRRASHKSEEVYGRMLSAIGLEV